MYERYREAARRAIYYASWFARLEETAYIDSVHLLRGLMPGDKSWANTLFELREHFPLYAGSPSKFATPEDVPARETFLTNEAKRIVVCAATEADMMGHNWINTEHLLLGILKEGNNVAAEYLARAGLTLKEARRMVKESQPSRPGDEAVPPEPQRRSPLGNLIHKWRMRR
jgi:ATP-dependent Clp protease ATP-binding subunit ClpC